MSLSLLSAMSTSPSQSPLPHLPHHQYLGPCNDVMLFDPVAGWMDGWMEAGGWEEETGEKDCDICRARGSEREKERGRREGGKQGGGREGSVYSLLLSLPRILPLPQLMSDLFPS